MPCVFCGTETNIYFSGTATCLSCLKKYIGELEPKPPGSDIENKTESSLEDLGETG